MASMTTSTDPFPPRAASQMHSFIRLRLYCFSRPALFFKRAPFVRGYGGIVGERDNQLKLKQRLKKSQQYISTYVLMFMHCIYPSPLRLRQSKHTPQHSLRHRQLQAQLVDVLSHCSQYTFQFHHLLICISLPLSLPHSTRMRFRLRI